MVGQSVSRSMVSTPSTSEPVLKAVLASLDIQMEEELARYRRHRLLQRRSQPIPAARTPASGSTSGVGAALPAVSPSASATPYPELMPSPWDEPNTGAIASALHPEAANGEPSTAMPDDYLESSEHLLRSLGDDELEMTSEADPGLMDRLLTPTGVGALLLLLVSSAMLGFLIVNPSMLGIERWGGLLQRDTDPSSSPATTDPSEQSDRNTRPYPNLAANEFIDLNLDTLSTLPGRTQLPTAIAVNPSPNPATSPTAAPETVSIATIGVNGAAPTVISTTDLPSNSIAIAEPAPVLEAAPEPAPLPEVAPEPVAATPAYVEPAPAPAAAAPAKDPSSYYYVVTDYSSDRSLEDAQSVVGDAYVRNFNDGAQVQLGAFSSPEGAQALIQQLQQQGISAEVYQP
jgi:hypothetical protein